MDLQEVLALVLLIAGPIAGVVAFGVQLRTIKKLRLENLKLAAEKEKLDLEVRLLTRKVDQESARIVIAGAAELETALREREAISRIEVDCSVPTLVHGPATQAHRRLWWLRVLPWFRPSQLKRPWELGGAHPNLQQDQLSLPSGAGGT